MMMQGSIQAEMFNGKMCYTRIILCVVLFGYCSAQFGSAPPRHVVLPPSGSGSKEIALIIIPEQDVRNIAYATLAEEIQISSNLPIWVGIMDTKSITLTSETFPILWAELLEELAMQGLNVDVADIFLAGHGSRGSFAVEFGLLESEMLGGIILFGSLLPLSVKSSAFPIPLLTITGELDGLTKITDVAQFYRQMSIEVADDSSVLESSPLVLLQGCNHALFSAGELSDSMIKEDIKSEVNDDDARMLVANYTVRFIGSVTKPPSFQSSAKSMFSSAYKTAASVLQPIVDILSLTSNEALESEWIEMVQKWLSGLDATDLKKLSVESYILEDASAIPPSLINTDNKTQLITFAEIDRSSGTTDEIAARMIGPERMKEWFGNDEIVEKYNCKDLNYASYMTAYHMASEIARERYDSFHKGIIFHDDKLMQSNEAWDQSHLIIETIDHELHVTAPNYQTPVSEALGKWTGIFFCKLLPLDRALEWIYVDALKNNLSPVQGK